MEQDNLETVRRVYDAFNARDMHLIQQFFADDFEVVQTPELPWGGTYYGHQGLYEFLVKLIEHIDSQVVPEAFFAAGDRVVQSGRSRGKAIANGASFDIAIVHVWQLRNGQVVRYEAYMDTPGMLEVLARPPADEPLS